jgi:hypothetical protein
MKFNMGRSKIDFFAVDANQGGKIMFKILMTGILFCVAVGFAGIVSAAPEMKEGLWEITVRMEAPGMPMHMPAFKHTQCMRKENMVPEAPRQQQGEQCRIIKSNIKGNTVSWVVECDAPEGKTRGDGAVTYHGDRFEGVSHFQQGGVKMTQRMTGKWLGPCK